MSVWLILAATGLYVAGLFALARRQDQRAATPGFRQHPAVYALALTVYCTSWTYFGAVGTAASTGWDYLPIYLGPALMFLLYGRVIERIGDIAKRESITSLSDFLSARYGKSRGVAALATLAAVTGSLPYISLQLKSVGMSFSALAGGSGDAGNVLATESVIITAIVLAGFAILFGARHADTTRKNAGLMAILAAEAIVKLFALIAVATLAIFLLLTNEAPTPAGFSLPLTEESPTGRFITITLLSMAAIICLPRQFHVAMIERRSRDDLRVGRRLFPLYLLLTSIVVLPIAMAGQLILPSSVAPDLFVLALPQAAGQDLLGLFVFLGGFSAATGMVVVSTIALSTMVTHDLVVPGLMRAGRLSKLGDQAGAQLLLIRRSVIIVLLMLAVVYYQVAANSEALARIGLLSFAAAAQFAPALIGAVSWRGGKATGVIAGLSVGMLVWSYTLFLPAAIGAEAMAAVLPGWLDPHALFGFGFGDSLTHGVFWSLGLNIVAFIIVSLRAGERLRDRIQAAAFVDDGAERIAPPAPHHADADGVSPDGLHALAARFLSAEAVDHAFAKFAKETGVPVAGDDPADWRLVQRTERLLASALGTSSARVVMSSAVGGADVAFGDLLSILDHKTQAERFDRHMLQAMLENVAQGISVVDGQQRLVAWNSAYVDLFDYPADLIKVGQPIGRLIGYNVSRGWVPGADLDRTVQRRIDHMKAGKPHRFERRMPDGRYIRLEGSPMPGGGYLTTFTDISEDKVREEALVEANEHLESRVRERTKDIASMAEALDAARQEAVAANASKTRFLAAASHDLLQPLNAARLFLGALEDREADDPATAALVDKADRSIQSADALLKGLLDITRLDHSDVKASPIDLPLGPLLDDLVEEATPMAEKVGLSIRLIPTSLRVHADPDFLQSIIRNFLSNARRYTLSGGIVVGARRRGEAVRIEVWDTGPGIAPENQAQLFEEFARLTEADNLGMRGAGLGLSVAARLSAMMGAEIKLSSVQGKGSCFSLTVPRAFGRSPQRLSTPSAKSPRATETLALTILCIDDEQTILDGMDALLTGWGATVYTAANESDARAIVEADPEIDVVIADYQLQDGETGLSVLSRLHPLLPGSTRLALLTANSTSELSTDARQLSLPILRKPIDPQELRRFLSGADMPLQAAE